MIVSHFGARRSFALLFATAVAMLAGPAAAQKLETLYTFTDGDDGAAPMGKLGYAAGVLYGTTTGGNGGTGSIFA